MPKRKQITEEDVRLMEKHLRQANRQAETLRRHMVSHLFEHEDLLRARAARADPELASLYRLHKVLDDLFTAHEVPGPMGGKTKGSER